MTEAGNENFVFRAGTSLFYMKLKTTFFDSDQNPIVALILILPQFHLNSHETQFITWINFWNIHSFKGRCMPYSQRPTKPVLLFHVHRYFQLCSPKKPISARVVTMLRTFKNSRSNYYV